MALLTGETIVSTYEQLLKITSEDITAGVNAKFIEDGKGTDSALSISQDRVGVGTATPISALEIEDGTGTGGAILTLGTKETAVDAADVLGRINFYAPLETGTDAIAVAASIVAIAEATFAADNNSTSLQFQTGASEVATTKMTIDEAGLVGIGISQPTENLHIYGAGVRELLIESTDEDSILDLEAGAVGKDSIIQFNANGDASAASIVYDHHATPASAKMQFLVGDNATTAVTILGDGKVGIGTTSPGTLLTVQGADNAAGAIAIQRQDTGDLAAGESIGSIYFAGHDDEQGAGVFGTGALIQVTADDSWSATTYDYPSNINFYTQTGGGGNGFDSLRMVIKSEGQVGIGTAAPAHKFHIREDSNDATIALSVTDDTADWLIGVHDGDSDALKICSGNTMGSGEKLSFYTSKVVFNNDNENVDFQFKGDTGDNVLYVDGGNDRVGIGKAAPDTSLHVAGSYTTSGGGLTIETTHNNADSSAMVNLFMLTQGTTSRCRIAFGDDGSDTAAHIVYDHGINTYSFTTATTADCLVIKVDGKVGIGTTAPVAPLDILGSSAAIGDARYTLVVSDDTNQAAGVGGGIVFSGENTDDNPAVTAFAAIWGEKENATSAEDGGELHLGTRVNGGTISSDLVIDSAGHVGIGTNTATHFLSLTPTTANGTEAAAHFAITGGGGFTAFHWIDATAYYIGQNSGSRGLRVYSSAETAGAELAAGGTSFGTFSDERVKRDIVEIDGALDKLKDIRCVNYNYKSDDEDQDKRMGVIAQDLIGKYDEVLYTTQGWGDLIEDDNEYYSVTYQDLIPPLIKAIQELSAKVEALENA